MIDLLPPYGFINSAGRAIAHQYRNGTERSTRERDCNIVKEIVYEIKCLYWKDPVLLRVETTSGKIPELG